jgi:hypothetical protein
VGVDLMRWEFSFPTWISKRENQKRKGEINSASKFVSTFHIATNFMQQK